jgi:hypothetical protein
VKHISQECGETKHWRVKLIHDKWLNMNKLGRLYRNNPVLIGKQPQKLYNELRSNKLLLELFRATKMQA